MRSIDVHAHLTPQCFWQATENGGDWHTLRRETDARGHGSTPSSAAAGRRCRRAPGGRRRSASPTWTRSAWTCTSSPPTWASTTTSCPSRSPAPPPQAINDEIAGMARAWPERFAGLGTLPMQDVKAAIAELERCMAQLGLKGVGDQRPHQRPDARGAGVPPLLEGGASRWARSSSSTRPARRW